METSLCSGKVETHQNDIEAERYIKIPHFCH